MNFPLDVTYYLKRYDTFFDDAFCNTVVASLEKTTWDKHKYYTSSQEYITYEDDLKISYNDIREKEIITTAIKTVIEKYIFYDMPQAFTWFKNYNGYSNIRFNRYDQNTSMRPHCDHIHDLFDGERKGVPILSIVGALNNNYEGGDFVMWGEQKIEIPAGSIIVFPSNFMFPHCVTPVTAGTRYSFVSWVF